MSESFSLPTEPEGVIPSLLERFDSGKVETMLALYAPEAVFIAKTGEPSCVNGSGTHLSAGSSFGSSTPTS